MLCRIAALSKDSKYLYGSLNAPVGYDKATSFRFLPSDTRTVVLIIPVASAVFSKYGTREASF